MNVSLIALLGVLAVMLPSAAGADVIPISEVNADDASGHPLLWTEVVTVRGVVTVGTGSLASNNEIYIQDATGGVCVIQIGTASPVVARGDSVEVKGKVDVRNGKRTCLEIDAASAPGTKMFLVNSGNAVPEPLELTARELMLGGEEHEGSLAVVRDVGLLYSFQWPGNGCTGDRAAGIADDDTSCWLWFDKDTDLCGSAPPLESFDAYGVVIPDPRPLGESGHGILPPERSSVRSHGSGAGYAAVNPEWVYEGDDVDLEFELTGEADTLSRVRIEIPGAWSGFSGEPGDVILEGDAFAAAQVDADSTTAEIVTLSGAGLAYGASGSITLEGLTPPSSVSDDVFVVKTAVGGEGLIEIVSSPSVHTAVIGPPGSVLINEVYAFSVTSFDRAEFIELVNTEGHAIDLSGWVLTDIDNSGECGGSNLWEFPEGAQIDGGGYLVVAKDARYSGTTGFYAEFFFYPDYELVDDDFDDVDYAGVPNLSRVSPSDQNNLSSQEIMLLGGPIGNGAKISNTPAYEAVYLYSDRQQRSLVDAMEYRDPVFLSADYCTGEPQLGGSEDAYTPGPTPSGYSLGRDVASNDSDNSAADFILSSAPTPGEVNVPVDDEPPGIVDAAAAGSSFVTVKFSEAIDADDAVNTSYYDFTGELEVHEAWLSRDQRTVLLRTGPQEAEFPYVLTVSGNLTDLAGNPFDGTPESFIGSTLEQTALSEIQAYDEMGYSPLWGQNVATIGFATVPPGIFQPDRTNMYIQDLEGWGVNVYSYDLMAQPALAGDLLMVTGRVTEYRAIDQSNPYATPAGSTTEIEDAGITVLARGYDVVQPTVLATGDVGFEENEGTLVRTSGVVVTHDGFAIYIDDGTGSTQVYQNMLALDFSRYALGDSIAVTGVVLQYDYSQPYFDGYELAPRYDSDLEMKTAHYSEAAQLSATARVINADEGESVDISFNAPRASQIAVRIFDLQGKTVATVYDGFCLGPSRASWDARDDSGRKVPAGVYICHVQAKGQSGRAASETAVPVVVGMKLD